jgi:hypothetical protein
LQVSDAFQHCQGNPRSHFDGLPKRPIGVIATRAARNGEEEQEQQSAKGCRRPKPHEIPSVHIDLQVRLCQTEATMRPVCDKWRRIQTTRYEGTGPATVHTAAGTGSIERTASVTSTAATVSAGGADESAGNGHDSNDNSKGLAVRTSRNPQNSGSAKEP